jgi:hypothetical protein
MVTDASVSPDAGVAAAAGLKGVTVARSKAGTGETVDPSIP